MKQKCFASAGSELVTKGTRKREFLDEINLLMPWAEMVAVTTPYTSACKASRPLFPVATVLRVHFLQQCFACLIPP